LILRAWMVPLSRGCQLVCLARLVGKIGEIGDVDLKRMGRSWLDGWTDEWQKTSGSLSCRPRERCLRRRQMQGELSGEYLALCSSRLKMEIRKGSMKLQSQRSTRRSEAMKGLKRMSSNEAQRIVCHLLKRTLMPLGSLAGVGGIETSYEGGSRVWC